MLSNINNRNRNDTHIGLSEHTSTYFSNNIDNHQPEQQLNHRTNESSNSKGNDILKSSAGRDVILICRSHINEMIINNSFFF